MDHADPKTTMSYVDDGPRKRERLIVLAADEATTLDETAKRHYSECPSAYSRRLLSPGTG